MPVSSVYFEYLRIDFNAGELIVHLGRTHFDKAADVARIFSTEEKPSRMQIA